MACDPATLIEDAKCACDTNPVTGVIENLWCQIANGTGGNQEMLGDPGANEVFGDVGANEAFGVP